MKISAKDFRVREGDEVKLKKWPALLQFRSRFVKSPEALTLPKWAEMTRFWQDFGSISDGCRRPLHCLKAESAELPGRAGR